MQKFDKQLTSKNQEPNQHLLYTLQTIFATNLQTQQNLG